MGYTQYIKYYTTELDQERWNKFTKNCRVLLKNLPEKSVVHDEYENAPLIITGCGRYKRPQFTKEHVWFNGGGEFNNDTLDHETCVIRRKRDKDEMFDFCKTAQKPYDFMVCAVFFLLQAYFPKEVHISSDGDYEEWEDAIEWVKKLVPSKEVAALLVKGFTP